MYLEKWIKQRKRKKEVYYDAYKGAVAATVGSGKVVVDDSKPDLNLKGN